MLRVRRGVGQEVETRPVLREPVRGPDGGTEDGGTWQVPHVRQAGEVRAPGKGKDYRKEHEAPVPGPEIQGGRPGGALCRGGEDVEAGTGVHGQRR